MHILIINNHSKHIDLLTALLARYGQINLIDRDDFVGDLTEQYDLIVLSGGSDYPVYTHPAYYSAQTKLLQETDTPILGICLGAELITYVFGGHLIQLPQKLTCTMPIQYMDAVFDGIPTTIRVAERHRRCIATLGPELDGLAKSSFGYEIIKHKKRPIYGLQFHPEIDPDCLGGDDILDRLLFSDQFSLSL